MVSADSESRRYVTQFTNGTQNAQGDTTAEKGGSGLGFRPHELLEAALAVCLNIHLRMYADNHGIELQDLHTTVSLDRDAPSEAIFGYTIETIPPVGAALRERLEHVAESCPVHRTLMRTISFRVEHAAGAGEERA